MTPVEERIDHAEAWQAVEEADREWAAASMADDHKTPAKRDRKVAACANFAHAARAYLKARLPATESAQSEDYSADANPARCRADHPATKLTCELPRGHEGDHRTADGHWADKVAKPEEDDSTLTPVEGDKGWWQR